MLNLKKETKEFFKNNKDNILKRKIIKLTEDCKWGRIRHMGDNLRYLSKTQGFFNDRYWHGVHPEKALNYLEKQPKTAENYKKRTFLEKKYIEAGFLMKKESRDARLRIALDFFQQHEKEKIF